MIVRTVRGSILQFEFFWAIRIIDNRRRISVREYTYGLNGDSTSGLGDGIGKAEITFRARQKRKKLRNSLYFCCHVLSAILGPSRNAAIWRSLTLLSGISPA